VVYDPLLADRIKKALARKKGIETRKMFGGMAFLLNGNLLVGAWKNALIARIGPEQGELALLESHVKPFDITGKPMKNWVMVDQKGIATDEQLDDWIGRSFAFVRTLPKKND
jgi:TfoX/Sxy family transcriptional regulator of competence genes